VGFTQDAADMDQSVDQLLGDDLLYKAAGMSLYVPLLGFATTPEQALGFGEIDVVSTTRRIKVSKLLVPTPSRADRWKCPEVLGDNVFQMMTEEAQTAGRYWIFDVQRVSTNL
jgi:hypothetical protein